MRAAARGVRRRQTRLAEARTPRTCERDRCSGSQASASGRCGEEATTPRTGTASRETACRAASWPVRFCESTISPFWFSLYLYPTECSSNNVQLAIRSELYRRISDFPVLQVEFVSIIRV